MNPFRTVTRGSYLTVIFPAKSTRRSSLLYSPKRVTTVILLNDHVIKAFGKNGNVATCMLRFSTTQMEVPAQLHARVAFIPAEMGPSGPHIR
jgi:hypothetical protein